MNNLNIHFQNPDISEADPIKLREGIKRGAETLENMQKSVCVISQSVHGIADDERINEWELKAAKRALMNLRELLYGEPMMKLLADQLEQAANLHKGYLAQSEGKWAETEVVLTAKGVKATAIPQILAESFALAAGDEASRKNMCMTLGFPMHPEHYAVPVPMSVVETMGCIPTLTLVARDENPPEFVRQKLDSQYPIQFTGKGVLQDGTEHSFVLQQFKDTDEGLQASLRIWYPAACPAEYLEEHAEHYTVEFRNLFRTIAEKMKD